MSNELFLAPDWLLPAGVHCLVTTKESGNLAFHVDDDPGVVAKNRKNLRLKVGNDVEIQWLQQVHGTEVFELLNVAAVEGAPVPQADAIFTTASKVACSVLTADCLPVMFCDRSGSEIAIAHAGWKGLLGGVLENTIAAFTARPKEIIAWLGPAIGPCHFEVGKEVKDAFVQAAKFKDETLQAFTPSVNQSKWMADLYQLARLRLFATGVKHVSGGDICTYCSEYEEDDGRKLEGNKFYSYRHNKNTGRFATMIWKD